MSCRTGLAVGDALGTTLEFKSPGSFRPIDDMVEPHRPRAFGGKAAEEMKKEIPAVSQFVSQRGMTRCKAAARSRRRKVRPDCGSRTPAPVSWKIFIIASGRLGPSFLQS